MDSRIPDFWLFHGLLRVCMSSKHGLLGGCLASGAFYAHSEMHAASLRGNRCPQRCSSA